MKKGFLTLIAAIAALAISLTGCKADKPVELLGAGASFPYPLYLKMFDEYNKATGAMVNYQAIGSGGGVKQITAKTVDFAGTDAYMTDEKIEATGAEIVHIPTCIGAVVATYNIPGNPTLKLDGKVLGDIFLGKITKWNDGAIKALNSDIELPELDIKVVHRSDKSGTTFVFTDYLSKVNSEWESKVGSGKAINWPTGLGGKKNAGVAGLVTQMPGSIGYVEISYAKQNGLPYADIKNKSGNFITPSLESASLAAQGEIPADTRIRITDTDAAEGYPITSFTWLVIYKEQSYNGRTKKQAKDLLALINWMIHDGQAYNEDLEYAKLPAKAVKISETILKSVVFDGKQVLK